MKYHKPVLLQEVLEALMVKPGGSYIDATVGTGGHAEAILERGGRVLGIDRDKRSLEIARRRLKRFGDSCSLVVSNFDRLETVAREQGFGRVSGVLFDLGMSSWQLDESGRGFSFSSDELLDMRLDPELGVTAADLVAALGRKELVELMRKFGQVERATAVAEAIVEARKRMKIKSTGQLVKIIEGVKTRHSRLHPATKVFMALRMAVNDELGSLDRALPQAVKVLGSKARLLVISFHEGEDRIIKHFIRAEGKLTELTKKPIRPGLEEVRDNPRASSAKLRVAEKTR